ncbi:hypothetical protein LC724_12035 [Blautia sp. RD014234]|nr:hypothetical protein [Blautia parvula]
MNPELIKNYCYVLGIMLKNAVYGILKPAQEQSYPDGSFETRVKNVFSMEELKEIMQRAAGGMVLMMKENGVEEPARDRLVIGQAKAYIAENYSKRYHWTKYAGICICQRPIFLLSSKRRRDRIIWNI